MFGASLGVIAFVLMLPWLDGPGGGLVIFPLAMFGGLLGLIAWLVMLGKQSRKNQANRINNDRGEQKTEGSL